ncbi:STAS-like domain-containing protein [Halobacteriovorax sp.]|uniref:STAS-like domain-containing protein n=1 Tax=Halobacteriovorax sp. TaxID=2020862 RepID=UPI003AF2285E
MTKQVIINVTEFTTTPGARYYSDGEFSGQRFRDEFLVPAFHENRESEIVVNLDGTEGYATSFLEEAFGGLVRLKDPRIDIERLSFISHENPFIIDEIKEYIDEAIDENK